MEERPIGLRQVVAPVAKFTGLARLLEWCTNARNVVVTFHRVYRQPADRGRFDSCPAVPVAFFRECLRYFKQKYEVVPLTELIGTSASRRPRLAVTFDDGWRDNYEVAFEILQEFAVPATIFMTVGKLADKQPFWQQRLGKFFHKAQEQPNGPLTGTVRAMIGANRSEPLDVDRYFKVVTAWKSFGQARINALLQPLEGAYPETEECRRLFLKEDELRELARNDVTIGSHTMTHPILTQETPEVVDWELRQSKASLEKILGSKVDLLAYPNGACSPALAKKAAACGYRLACTTREGTVDRETDMTCLPRIDVGWDRFMYRSGSFSAGLFQIDLMRALRSQP